MLSIAKHLAAVACLGVLVWKLLRDRAAVLLAMALFALHPSHTESVAWISVPDPLMAAAILVSLLLYFKYADAVPSIGKASRKGRKEEATREYPDEWFAWAGLGECFFKLNDMAKAEQSMHRASDLAHQPRVTEQWQQLRARMGLSPAPE